MATRWPKSTFFRSKILLWKTLFYCQDIDWMKPKIDWWSSGDDSGHERAPRSMSRAEGDGGESDTNDKKMIGLDYCMLLFIMSSLSEKRAQEAFLPLQARGSPWRLAMYPLLTDDRTRLGILDTFLLIVVIKQYFFIFFHKHSLKSYSGTTVIYIYIPTARWDNQQQEIKINALMATRWLMAEMILIQLLFRISTSSAGSLLIIVLISGSEMCLI